MTTRCLIGVVVLTPPAASGPTGSAGLHLSPTAPDDGAPGGPTADVDLDTVRRLFPLTGTHIFMNHAGVSPMSERGREAVIGVMDRLTVEPCPTGFDQGFSDRLRSLLARLLGTAPETIGIVRSTAHGISLLAQGLDWQPGDNVVGARGEYPANVYPWMALRDRAVEYRLAEPVEGRVTPASVLSLVDDRTRVVALSHVEFWNGYRVDLETIGAECRRLGVLVAVDAIQSVGALRVDLSRLPVDFVVAAAHKWQLGPVGIGFCHCRPELLPRLRPVLVGTGTVKRSDEYFDYDYDLRDTARRFEESQISPLLAAAYAAAIELLLEAGPETVEQRVLDLALRLAHGLADLGCELIEPWPRTLEESSGIVSFRRPGTTAAELLGELEAAGVVGRVRGECVRLAPHFYNTEEEVDRVLEVVGAPRR
jgi:selenocysteine lyase/cysteine desulfurase